MERDGEEEGREGRGWSERGGIREERERGVGMEAEGEEDWVVD